MPSPSRMIARIGGLLLAGSVCQAAPRQIEPVQNTVRMEVRLVGTGSAGHQIEIRPGHAACDFETIKVEVEAGREGQPIALEPFTVESTGADRDVSFLIIVREPGKPDRATRRGLRLCKPKPGEQAEVQELTYYLSARSMSARQPRTNKGRHR